MSLNLQLHGKGLEVTQALNEYTLKKFSKIEKHYKNIVSLKITLKEVQGPEHFVSADIHLAPKKHFHAQTKELDMYKAIDQLSKLITLAVDKHHQKKMQRNHTRRDDQLM